MVMLIGLSIFSPLTGPKRVPECADIELTLPPIGESHPPFAEEQPRFSPEGFQMITAGIEKLLERGVIRPSKSPWAAQVLCTKKRRNAELVRRVAQTLQCTRAGKWRIGRHFNDLHYFQREKTLRIWRKGFQKVFRAEVD